MTILKHIKKKIALLIFVIIPLLLANNAYGASTSHSDGFLSSHWINIDTSAIKDKVGQQDFYKVPGSGIKDQENSLLLPLDSAVEFIMDVEKDGKYNLVLEYDYEGTGALKNTVTLKWDNEELVAGLPMLWKDVNKNYQQDRYGNEMIPAQETLAGMHLEYIRDYSSINKRPFTLDIKKSKIKFTLKNNTQPLLLKAVYLLEEKAAPKYDEYKNDLGDKNQGSGMLIIEGEDYQLKSDSYIRAANVQNSALSPYESGTKLINTISDAAWKEPGQKLLWEFEVKEDGIYNIGFRYSQNTKQGMSVFRNIEIDGKVPVAEFREISFEYTGLDYDNMVLKDSKDQDIGIWLESGKHTIAMEVEAAPVEEIVNKLKTLMLKINDTSIDIKKLTGSGKDSNRTWDIEQYLPEIDNRLNEWANELDTIYNKLGDLNGKKPTYAVKLKMAAKNLRELARKPEKIPSTLTKLSEGSGSASQLIADIMMELSEHPLGLDRIYIFNGEKLPAADSSFIKKILEAVKSFVGSFFKDDNFAVSSQKDDKELEIWVARPLQYVQMLQSLTDSDFSPGSGIKVKFSVMPNETKLVLANSSGTNPDLALGISSHIPYELAIRGAVQELSEFDDFLSFVSQEYNLETLVSYSIDDNIYALTETQDFFVLMYRKDIIDKLKLPVPDTWEDVKNIMPELQRHSMGFYLPMSGWSGLKPFYTTAPFIYQSGGNIYNSDGISTAINEEKAINGFKLMTELFSIYSVEENAPNFFNSFRYGTLPIGVSNFSTYTRLMNAAPEITGLWEMAVAPGVMKEDGTVLRYQAANDKADVLFSNSDMKEEGWEFLKWWLSKDVQVKFANAMQTSFGPEYMWNTANLAAFEEMNFPEEHKKIILEQWKWQKEIPRHPGGYMVEREISNAWTDIVMDGKNLRTAVDKAALMSNREMRRKLEEFGYIENGKVISEYHVPTVEDIRERVKVGK